MEDIIAKIWSLPWYKVLCVAVIDDGILFVKLWWLWLSIVIPLIVVICFVAD